MKYKINPQVDLLDVTILRIYWSINKIAYGSKIKFNTIKYLIYNICIQGLYCRTHMINRVMSNSFCRDLSLNLKFYSEGNELSVYTTNDYANVLRIYQNKFNFSHTGMILIKKSNSKNIQINTSMEYECLHEIDFPNFDNKIIKVNSGNLYYGIQLIPSQETIIEHIFTSRNKLSKSKLMKFYKKMVIFNIDWCDSVKDNVFLNGKEITEPNVDADLYTYELYN